MRTFFNELSPNPTEAQKNQALLDKFQLPALLMYTREETAANREQLHDLFSDSTWNNLELDHRCAAVQALENDFALQQGRPPKEVEVNNLRDNCYGGWSAEADKIFLNENLLSRGTLTADPQVPALEDANMQVFDTIAHEGYHAYQSYALAHPEVHQDKEQLREWALNEGKYYNSEHYLIQPQERDAWQYGSQATNTAFQGIQQRCGEEPGWEEYENTVQMNSYDNALARDQARDPQVLEHMEQEMTTACQSKGLTYDFGETQHAMGREPDSGQTEGCSPQSREMQVLASMDNLVPPQPEHAPESENTPQQEEALERKYVQELSQ